MVLKVGFQYREIHTGIIITNRSVYKALRQVEGTQWGGRSKVYSISWKFWGYVAYKRTRRIRYSDTLAMMERLDFTTGALS